MSIPILREFFNALGITKAPKPIEPPECGMEEFGRRMVKLAMYMPDNRRDPRKAMG